MAKFAERSASVNALGASNFPMARVRGKIERSSIEQFYFGEWLRGRAVIVGLLQPGAPRVGSKPGLTATFGFGFCSSIRATREGREG